MCLTPSDLLQAERAAHASYQAALERWWAARDDHTHRLYLTARGKWWAARGACGALLTAGQETGAGEEARPC